MLVALYAEFASVVNRRNSVHTVHHGIAALGMVGIFQYRHQTGNIVVVKEGNEKSEKTQALVKALTSQEVKDYINNTYSGAVVPIF